MNTVTRATAKLNATTPAAAAEAVDTPSKPAAKPASTMNVGTNVAVSVEGGVVTLSFKLDAPKTPSKSGKTMIVATTGGNVTVNTPVGAVTIGLNAYVKE